MTALHLAAALGREAVLKQLIARGRIARAARRRWPDAARRGACRRPPRPGRLARLARLAVAAARTAGRRTCPPRRSSATPMRCGACSIWVCRSTPSTRRAAPRCCARPAAAIAPPSICCSRAAPIRRRAANTGATPLSAAVSMRQADIVDGLLAAGAELEQRLPGDVTVLMLAAALGLPDLRRAPAHRRRQRPGQRRARPDAAALRRAVRIHRARHARACWR